MRFSFTDGRQKQWAIKRGILTVTIMVLFLMVLAAGMPGDVGAAIPSTERAALIALYKATDGDNWTDNDGWKTSPLASDGFGAVGTEGSWHGVTATNDRVTAIKQGSNNLSGRIPSELVTLTELEYLYLHKNKLTGDIPEELGKLTRLRGLALYENNLTGDIPVELGNLTGLKWLWLDANSLSGSIPAALGDLANLLELHLNKNDLTGDIPAELGNLTKLTSLWLHANNLTGSIPLELGDLTELEYLYLRKNNLTGDIPAELGNLAMLRGLALYENNLTGNIPVELGNLTKLKYLWLDGNSLSGSIPAELGDLTNLLELHLNENNLTGNIPAELGNLTKLTSLWLHANKLTGAVPDITRLTSLEDGGLDIGCNGLYSDETTVKDFLDAKDPDWSETQTVAPTDVAGETTGAGTARLTWTPIVYTGDSGGYEIYRVDGSDYILAATTPDKKTDFCLISGLTAETTYAFVVRTRTEPHGNNINTVISGYSDQISVTTKAVTPGYHTITAAAGAGGSIDPSGTVDVNDGTDITFTITADTDYQVMDVKVDGMSQGAVTSYTFSNVTADHTIEAFSKEKVTSISISSWAGTGFITIDVSSTPGAYLVNAEAMSDADSRLNRTGRPDGMTFPHGLIAYTVKGIPYGETVPVTITFPDACSSASLYYKADADGFSEFSDAEISGHTVTLTLTDGGAGDQDGTVDGKIVDPGGIAEPEEEDAPDGGGGGGCFMATSAYGSLPATGTAWSLAIMLFVFLLSFIIVLGRKK